MYRSISEKGKAFLRETEGWESKMYKDQAGHPTIGCGHKLTVQELNTGNIVLDEEVIAWKNGLNDDQIARLKDRDSKPVEVSLNTQVKVPLSQDQFDALAAFIFNVGIPRFEESSLLVKLNASDYGKVPDELRRWVYITQKGKGRKIKSDGLVNRRDKEINLWLGKWKAKGGFG